jgi:hypothetical protein
MKEACCSSQVGKESPQKKMKMTTNGHEGIHIKRKRKDAKENCIKGMIQEYLDIEMVELKEGLGVVMMFLEACEKDQCYGWTMKKKKVRWKLL